LYNRVAFGTLKTKYIDRFSDLTLTEASVLIALTIPMLVLGVSANIVLIFTDIAVNDIFYFQTY
jgi:NADH:ubiquinone oxidoreductase subunit 4 (subunit M)